VIRDSRLLPLVTSFSSITVVGCGISHVLEGNCTVHVLPGKYSLVLPFHEDLDVGGHGGAVSACGPIRAFKIERGEERRGG
jgi:hypothetical protein